MWAFTLTKPQHHGIAYVAFARRLDRVVNIQNNNTLMDVAPNYLHVYMQPGHRRCSVLP